MPVEQLTASACMCIAYCSIIFNNNCLKELSYKEMANILNYSNTFQFNAITGFLIFTYKHLADIFLFTL